MSFNLKINDNAKFTRPAHMIDAGQVGGDQERFVIPTWVYAVSAAIVAFVVAWVF